MKFFNAFKGVKKIRTAQVLALLSSLAVIAVVGYAIYKGETPEALSESTMGVFGIVMLVAGIFSILALLLTFIGLIQAKRDEGSFGGALALTLIALVISVVDSFYRQENYAEISPYVSVGISVLTLLATILTVKGCMDLAKLMDRQDVVRKGGRVIAFILIAGLVSAGCELATSVFNVQGTLKDVVEYAQIAAPILSVLYTLVYIGFLGKTKKMLKG